jgi:hypothetical protein
MTDDISRLLPTTGRSTILATHDFTMTRLRGPKRYARNKGKPQLMSALLTTNILSIQADIDGLTIIVAADAQSSQKKDKKSEGTSAEGKEILVDAHLRLKYGQRYGLLGRNGTGKSSKFITARICDGPVYSNVISMKIEPNTKSLWHCSTSGSRHGEANSGTLFYD